jgi:hypothetical protein
VLSLIAVILVGTPAFAGTIVCQVAGTQTKTEFSYSRPIAFSMSDKSIYMLRPSPVNPKDYEMNGDVKISLGGSHRSNKAWAYSVLKAGQSSIVLGLAEADGNGHVSFEVECRRDI